MLGQVEATCNLKFRNRGRYMLDGVSLDQLRTFLAVADEGSFSAAGRRLRRAQSVVSQALANLEGQLRVKLFDRSGHLPVLTDQGRALLANARAVAGDVDLLKARAKNLAGGLEPELSVAIDVMFPDATFTHAVAAFQKEFPATLLRFDVESSAVIEPVLDRRCAIGVVGSWALIPPQLSHEVLLSVRVSMVVSPEHPLASRRGPIPTPVLAEHIHISHIDPHDMTGVFGATRPKYPRTWRLSHFGAKLAFLRAGLGFGSMPLHTIEAELASGALIEITSDRAPPGGHVIDMVAIYRTDSPPGPAGRWFIDHLKQPQAPHLNREQSRPQPLSVAAKVARRRPSIRLLASKTKQSR
jgi:DNA-binding transcriptional LysR family regulator